MWCKLQEYVPKHSLPISAHIHAMFTITRTQPAIKGLLNSIRNRSIKTKRKLYLSWKPADGVEWFDELVGATPKTSLFSDQFSLNDQYPETAHALRLWELLPDGSKKRHLELLFSPRNDGTLEEPSYVCDAYIGNDLFWLFPNDASFVS